MTQTGMPPGIDGTMSPQNELLELANHLNDLIRASPPLGGQPIGEAWILAIRKNLAALHERLQVHFQEEERSGLPARLIAGVPHIADRVASLRREHDLILAEIQALLDATDNVRAQGAPAYARFHEGTSEALQRLFRNGGLETERSLLVYS